jgi:glutamate-1-semialdehyde 2,1-aminomutase
LKFSGCYHGHVDALLVRAGSGAATFGVPDSAGVPEAAASHTLVANFNDLHSVRAFCEAEGAHLAAIIVEPIVGNMGVIPPAEDFLPGLRRLADEVGALLIFDEVMTGFRLRYGAVQDALGVRPDLTCLGKIVGGGLPLAAFGGRRDLMEKLAPLGPVYQAGTLSGNPLAVTTGLQTLDLLAGGNVYESLDTRARDLEAGLRDAITAWGGTACINRRGSMWTIFFGVGAVHNPDDARRCDTDLYARWFRGMLGQGVYLPPSQFEAAFVSAAHGQEEIDATVQAAMRVLPTLR